jgi:hypothetical protein
LAFYLLAAGTTRLGRGEPPSHDELDTLAGRESELLDRQTERRQLACRGIAGTRRTHPAHRQRDCAESAPPQRPRLVVIDQHERRATHEPRPDRRQARLSRRRIVTRAEERHDRRRGGFVSIRQRRPARQRGGHARGARTHDGDTAVQRPEQREAPGREHARHRRAINVMNSSRVF